MYVCVCMAVTERQIQEAVGDGARTLKDLRRMLGVGSECGSCAVHAQQCLDQFKRALPEAEKPQRRSA